MDELKQIISKKLIQYRRAAKLTQAQVAKKISYSDKSISKWERGEALPDVAVLKELATIYGVTVEHLISPNNKQMKLDSSFMQTLKEKQMLVTLLSVSLVWFIATLLFVTLKMVLPAKQNLSYVFILALPITFIVTTVFCRLWANIFWRALSVSFLNWSATLSFFLIASMKYRWLIFLLSIPIQVIIILWFLLKRKNKLQKSM